VNSLVNNIQLVTKIYFPREILPLSALLASLVDYHVASTIFVAMIIFYRFPLSPTIVLVPVLLVIQIDLMTWIILFASALTVFYRDIRFIVTLGLQLWLYLTPVIYPLIMVPERFRTLYLLNPMASLIESYRQVVLLGQWPDPIYLMSAAVFALVLLVGSYVYFKRSEAVFADII
jgi:lipopolysaccharide transport system permease protein